MSECRRRRASVFRKLGGAEDVGEDRETTHPVHHELPLRSTVHGDENLAQGDRGRLAATLRVGRRGHLRGGVVVSVANAGRGVSANVAERSKATTASSSFAIRSWA